MPNLRMLRNGLGYTQSEMAKILGIKQNAYSSIETGKVSLTDRNKKILIEQLHINPDWLDDVEGSKVYIEIKKNEAGNKTPSTEERQWRPYIDIDKFAAKIKVISDEHKRESKTRPRIPYTAAAGSLTSAVDGVTESECEQIPVITAFPSYDFTMFVKGDSMYPNYEGGDEVACKRIDSTSFIQWGKVHVLDTAQGIVIKRVYDDEGNVKCVSYNKEYPDFTISKEEVYSMSLVVGMIRL